MSLNYIFRSYFIVHFGFFLQTENIYIFLLKNHNNIDAASEISMTYLRNCVVPM